jgi:hypothetical protein
LTHFFVVFVVTGVPSCLKKISPENINLLSRIRRMLLGVCQKIDAYEQSKKKSQPKDELFFVSIKNDGIYLNDTKIIAEKAGLQFAIFRILLDLYVREFFAAELKYVTIPQIRAILESQKIFVEDEKQIRTAIY